MNAKGRNLEEDEEVQRWCKNLELEVDANPGKKQSGITRTGNLSEMSSRSGRSTAISRKVEKLASAKLKVTQLKKQHQLQRKMTELKFEKEMMEAQMEEERAAVSFIYEPDNEEEHNLDHYEKDRLQLRDDDMDRSGLKSINSIQTSKANRETFSFPKELYVSRGLKTGESIEILCGTTYTKAIWTRIARVKAKHCIDRDMPPAIESVRRRSLESRNTSSNRNRYWSVAIVERSREIQKCLTS